MVFKKKKFQKNKSIRKSLRKKKNESHFSLLKVLRKNKNLKTIKFLLKKLKLKKKIISFFIQNNILKIKSIFIFKKFSKN